MSLPIVQPGATHAVSHHVESYGLDEMLIDIGRDNPVVANFIAGWLRSTKYEPGTNAYSRVAGLAVCVYKLLEVQDQANELEEDNGVPELRKGS